MVRFMSAMISEQRNVLKGAALRAAHDPSLTRRAGLLAEI
jgi:hypothetical protein